MTDDSLQDENVPFVGACWIDAVRRDNGPFTALQADVVAGAHAELEQSRISGVEEGAGSILRATGHVTDARSCISPH